MKVSAFASTIAVAQTILLLWLSPGLLSKEKPSRQLDNIFEAEINCGSSCKACNQENFEECSECLPYMFLDPTTSTCMACSDGFFFEDTTQTCMKCNSDAQDGSDTVYYCNKRCAYQKSCFKCQGTLKFDLASMQCVEECDEDSFESEIINEDWTQTVCRQTTYFINPDSEEVMELGTREYPLRNINLALLDIFNIHANTERSIQIFVMELTQNYLKPEFAQIINVTSVSFDSYSDYTPSNPQRAILVISDTEKELITEKAMFSIHQNVTKKSLDISRMELMEYGEIFQTTDYAILVNRANVSFNNFDVVSELSSPSSSVSFVYTNFCFFKTITFTNMHFEVQGLVFENNMASVNVLAENITLDMYKSTGGFVYNSFCNYPEAMNQASVELRSINAYMSQYKIMQFGFLFVTGNANITLHSMTTSAYMTMMVPYPFIGYFSSPVCIPDDEETQIFLIDEFESVLPNNEGGEKITIITLFTPTSSTRYYKFLVQNSVFRDRNNEQMVFLAISGKYNEDVILKNITFTDVVSNYFSMTINGIRNLTLDGVYQSNYQHNGNLLWSLNGLNVTLKDIHIQDSHTEVSEALWISLMYSKSVHVSNLLVEDCTLLQEPIISILSNVDQTMISNVTARNLSIGPSGSIIGINNARMFEMNNLAFTNIHSMKKDSTSIFMVTINGINFQTEATDRSIRDVTVSQSTTGVVFVTNVYGTAQFDEVLLVENLHISDCVYNSHNSIGKVTNSQFEGLLNILFNNSIFENIKFVQGGNFLVFEHLSQQQVSVANCVFRNNIGGSISLEGSVDSSSSLKTKVLLTNVTAINMNELFGSFIDLNTGSELEVANSSFSNVFSYDRGAIIYTRSESSIAVVSNTMFYNNSALLGGTIYADTQSLVELHNCKIYNNFAVEGGVIATGDNGHFEITNSKINENYAVSGLVANIFNSHLQSKITSSEIASNIFIGVDILEDEMHGECLYLCFLTTDFVTYLTDHSGAQNIIASDAVLKLIFGNLQLSSMNIHSQAQVIDSYLSEIEIVNTQLEDIEISSNVVLLFSASSVNIFNLTMSNIMNSALTGEPILACASNSKLNMTNFDLMNSETSLLYLSNSDAMLSESRLYSISTPASLITIYKSNKFEMNDTTITDINASSSSLFLIMRSISISINKLNVQNVQRTVIKTLGSSIQEYSQLSIVNCTKGVHLYDHSSAIIANSSFALMGNEDTQNGGAIESRNSNITIKTSTFIYNRAKAGGSVALLCDLDTKCIFDVSRNTFANNSATEKGGALFYNLYRPSLKNNTFANNIADYGNNIASYPVRIKLSNIVDDSSLFERVASSQVIPAELQYELVDFDNQVLVIDNISSIKISKIEVDTSVKGTVEAIVNNGIAVFNNLILQAPPGSQNVKFIVDSNAINKDRVTLQYGRPYEQEYIIASFRYCESGEIEQDNKCLVCSAGTYSLGVNQTECRKCMSNAVCLGGKEISVNSGYYRLSQNASHVTKCIRSNNCKGGYVDTEEHPVNCKEGHRGILCSQCVVTDDVKYEGNSDFSCSKCPNIIVNAIRFVFIIGAIFTFFTIMIVINILKKGESQKSTLLRILTNYLQIITTALAMNSNFPSIVKDLFVPAEKVGSSSESFVSIECFIEESELSGFTSSAKLFKIFMTALLPVVLVAIYCCLWVAMHFFVRKWKQDIKRNVVVSTVVTVYMLHPTLTNSGLSILQCVKVDEDDYRVRVDLDMKCYSSEHIKWFFMLGVPIILIWGIGIPSIGLTILIRSRSRLNEWSIQKYMLMLYQGLKLNRFYWEFVNTLRKIMLLFISVVLATFPINYKALCSVIVMVVILRLQTLLKPYKSKINNKLEQLEITTGTVTLLASMIFQDENNVEWIDLVIFILIIILNINFLMKWAYALTKTESDRSDRARVCAEVFEYFLCFKRKQRKRERPIILSKSKAGSKTRKKNEACIQPKEIEHKHVLEDNIDLSKSNTNYKGLLNKNIEEQQQKDISVSKSDRLLSISRLRGNKFEESKSSYFYKSPANHEDSHSAPHGEDLHVRKESLSKFALQKRKKKRTIMNIDDASISYIDHSHISDIVYLYDVERIHESEEEP